MTSLSELLTHVRELLERATPGPYDVRVREFSNHALTEVWTEFGWYQQLPRDYREPTTELFAASPALLAKLCRIIEVQNEALEVAVEGFSGIWDQHTGDYERAHIRAVQARVQAILEEV